MSPSKTKVTVKVADQQGQIRVLDANLSEIGSGATEIQLDLAPGIYKAMVSLGESSSEIFFSVNPTGTPLTVSIPALKLTSAVPLQADSDKERAQQTIISSAKEHPSSEPGWGHASQLFFCARFQTNTPFGRLPAFRLRTLDGDLLFDFAAHELSRHEESGLQAMSLSIQSGHYMLCHEPESGVQSAIAVHTVAGWRSQYYFRTDAPSSERLEGVPDLDGCAISMARITSFAESDQREERVSEIARRSMVAQSNSLSSDEMAVLLSGKFTDPILGLLAANLLILEQKPNIQTLRLVEQNLRRMLGKHHPDVVALGLLLYRFDPVKRSKPHLEGVPPPLLGRSLLIIQQALLDLDQKGSKWLPRKSKGDGLWLIWDVNQEARASRDDSDLGRLGDVLGSIARNSSAVEQATAWSFDEAQLLLNAEDADPIGEAFIQQVQEINWASLEEGLSSESTEASITLSKAQRRIIPTLESVSSSIAKGRKISGKDFDALRRELDISWTDLGEEILNLKSQSDQLKEL